jgi:hypothetical protein
MDVSVFNTLKKDNVRYVRMRNMEKCVTRSRCVTSSGILRVKGVPHDVFVKVSPCMYGRVIADTENKARKTPQYIETRMMKITNRLNTKHVCRSVVYCHNKNALKKNVAMVKGVGFHSILVTENVRAYMPFDDFLNSINDSDGIASVLFQLVYTLQCMNTIRLTHTDLHFGNMFVRHRPELEGYYDTYEFRYNKGYHKVKIPCKYQLKIIDFDGAHKGPITGLRQLKIYDPMFTKEIKNTFLPWGNPKVVNVRFDIMKVMFHLQDTVPTTNFKKLLKALGFVNVNKKVPYFDFTPNEDFPTRNINGANDYGMFYNKNGDFLKLTDTHIRRPKDIIVQCAIYMHRANKDKKNKEFDRFSQRGLGLRF